MTASIAWPKVPLSKSRTNRAPIRWQHRLKRGRPTCTERNQSLPESADGSMATVATRREKKLLTTTGLLMEALALIDLINDF